MIWRIPWAVGVVLLYVARVVSWVALPGSLHGRVWTRNLCRWAMHDSEVTKQPYMWVSTCKRCGNVTRTPSWSYGWDP